MAGRAENGANAGPAPSVVRAIKPADTADDTSSILSRSANVGACVINPTALSPGQTGVAALENHVAVAKESPQNLVAAAARGEAIQDAILDAAIETEGRRSIHPHLAI